MFLLQVQGRRRWRISAQRDLSLQPGLPLKVLRAFAPESEWILGPGDLLYLPPSIAHEGVALDDCLTASLGFRAPAFDELQREFLHHVADQAKASGRYADPGREPTSHPGELDDHLLATASAHLLKASYASADVIDFLGVYLSEPKPNVFFAAKRIGRAAAIAALLDSGAELDDRSILLYRGSKFFINGEALKATGAERVLLKRLSDTRQTDVRTADSSLQGLARAVAPMAHRRLVDAWSGPMNPDAEHPVAPLPTIPFETRTAFEQELVSALQSAQREVWLADASFRQWPLNSSSCEGLLHSFLVASRANRVHVLVADPQYLARDAARFMRLLRLFGQSLLVRRPPDEVNLRFAEDCSFLIVDRARMVRRFHRDAMRGVAEFHPNKVGPWVDQFQSVWEESSPGLSGTILGLSG